MTTPRIALRGATDDLLEELVPLVRAGQADADPPPFDDPMSLYESDPDTRVHKWLQAVWRGRGRVAPDFWRLYLVVVIDGQAVGVQDIIGTEFDTYGAVVTFSWLAADLRGRGFGREMREAALHLAFDGFHAAEAGSDAFVDNTGSNRVSETLGYERNGTTWSTRRGRPELCGGGASPESNGYLVGATTSRSAAWRPVGRRFGRHPETAAWRARDHADAPAGSGVGSAR